MQKAHVMKAFKYDLSPCAFQGRIKDEYIENVIIDFQCSRGE
jgi:hypothetical protein